MRDLPIALPGPAVELPYRLTTLPLASTAYAPGSALRAASRSSGEDPSASSEALRDLISHPYALFGRQERQQRGESSRVVLREKGGDRVEARWFVHVLQKALHLLPDARVPVFLERGEKLHLWSMNFAYSVSQRDSHRRSSSMYSSPSTSSS